MMKSVLSALALAAALATSATAATINFTATSSTGVPAGMGVDVGAASWVGTSDPVTVTGTMTSNFRSPYDQLGAPGTAGYAKYFAVGSPGGQPSPAILAFNNLRTSFKMLWGSIDTYNAINFCNGATCKTVTGSQILALTPGAGTRNAIVQFVADDFAFNEVRFFSNHARREDQAAFEFAVAAVPLPAGGLLLLGALGGIAALRRRKAAV